MKRILITGGAGFIGSHFARFLLHRDPEVSIIVMDKLTYAGNLNNLLDLQDYERFEFIQGDICDTSLVDDVAARADVILNFAAETHVDRSIEDASSFVLTNVYGTGVLLEAIRKHGLEMFVQISTDEVYGSCDQDSFTEDAVLNPTNPYAASKAAADHLVHSYFRTYGLPVKITRSCNAFGPNQFPEKLIPLMVTNALEDKQLPLYGDGMNVREWIYVEDLCEAIHLLLTAGVTGQIYNIGTSVEKPNREIAYHITDTLDKPEDLVTFVPDRPAHDARYSLNWSKLKGLGWKPKYGFEEAMGQTIEWYRLNDWWWRPIKTDRTAYATYYDRQYPTLGTT